MYTELYDPGQAYEPPQTILTEININTLTPGNTRLTELTQQLTNRIPREVTLQTVESTEITSALIQGLSYGLLAGLTITLAMLGASHVMSIWKT